jgi:hypothetical protein
MVATTCCWFVVILWSGALPLWSGVPSAWSCRGRSRRDALIGVMARASRMVPRWVGALLSLVTVCVLAACGTRNGAQLEVSGCAETRVQVSMLGNEARASLVAAGCNPASVADPAFPVAVARRAWISSIPSFSTMTVVLSPLASAASSRMVRVEFAEADLFRLFGARNARPAEQDFSWLLLPFVAVGSAILVFCAIRRGRLLVVLFVK